MPARYQTLGNFLDICLDPDSNPETMASAVELDPAILGAFLGFRRSHDTPLKYWYRDIDPAFFPALGLAMAHEYLIEAPDDEEVHRRLVDWRNSVLHRLLASRMADQLDSVDTDEARLAAVLTGLGPGLMWQLQTTRDQPFDHMIERADEDLAELTADLVAFWGGEPAFTDAIRYHHLDLDKLTDTSDLIKVVAVAGRLGPFVEGPEMVTPVLARQIQGLLGFNEDVIYEIIGEVSRGFSNILTRLQLEDSPADRAVTEQGSYGSSDESKAWCQFKYNLNHGTLAALFHNALERASPQTSLDTLIQDTGNFLFPFNRIVHMVPEEEQLKGTVGEKESITITSSSIESFVAQCYREHKTDSISASNVISVTDRQLLRRSSSDTLLCIYLGEKAGILVCGVDAEVPKAAFRRRHLLSSYANAIANTFEARQSGSQLNADKVKQRLREVSHEANNPLSIVQNYLRTLSLKLEDNVSAQKDIEAISNEIMRASDIIRKFGQIDLEADADANEVNINEVLQELIDIFSGGHENIIFKTDLDALVPTTIVRANDLRQVLVNILKNAAEALETDERIVDRGKQIIVSTCGSLNLGGHKYIEIAVADNGPGIPGWIRDQLFQSHLSSKGDHHSGLGLSIARQLVDDMGGIITCRSKVEEEGTPGTSFQVLVPQIDNNEKWNGYLQ